MNAGDELANSGAPRGTSSGMPSASGSSSALAVSMDCWTDLFELSRYRGRRRRFFGPANFAGLRSRQPTWGTSIDSLIVGPGAYVRLYNSSEPTSSGRWLLPRQVVEDLLALKVGEEVDSIEILADAPKDDHPGHAAFLMAIAQSKTDG